MASILPVFVLVFVAACALALDLERFLQIPNERATAVLGDATVDIIEKAYAPRAKVVNIFAATINQKNKYETDGIITYILNKLGGSLPYQLYEISSQTPDKRLLRLGSNFNLIFVDGFEALSRSWNAFIRGSSRSEEYFLIVLTADRIGNETEFEVVRLCFAFWSKGIANVYVIATADNDGDVVAKLYTFFPYNKKNCGKVYPVLVNEYQKNGFVTELNIFVDKFKNMNQCPIQVVVPLLNSLIFLSVDENGGKYLDGIEGKVLHYLAMAMNFKVDITLLHTDGTFGSTAVEMLSNGTAEIAIGGLVDLRLGSNEDTYFLAFPHLYDSLAFFQPIGIPYTPLQKLSMPFFSAVWIWLLVAFVVVAIVVAIVQYLIFGQSFLAQINIAMGGSITQMPRAIRARSLIAMWMFATLILRNAYHGALFDILQAQIRHHPVETIEDLTRFNYSIWCKPDMCKWLNDTLPQLKQQHRPYPQNGSMSHYELMRDESFRGVFVTTELNVAFYNKMYPGKEPLVILKERISSSFIAMAVKNDPFMITQFNWHIQNLASIGLLDYWKEETLEKKKTKNRLQKVPQKLELSHLEGILYICAALYAISFLVFVFEIILRKFQQ